MFHTPRNRKDTSVLRTTPCLPGLPGLFSLFSVVALVPRAASRGRAPKPPALPRYAKAEVTFSDAVAAVGRAPWQETVLKGASAHEAFQKRPPGTRETLPQQLNLTA